MLREVSQFTFFDFETPIWTVTELNQHIRLLLESDYRMQDVWVGGEVSNLSSPASGHLYFTLKDEAASLRCLMWRPDVARLVSVPKDGDAIEVHGRISVYEAGGQYQLYADRIRSAGEGILFREFLRLKVSLEAEGLFDPERKRPLPDWPLRIGVVTSPTAAAFRDVVNVLRRRFPLAEVIISPTPVQGEGAPPKIVKALQVLNQVSGPDLILVVRGGGSIEDLWAFNDEAVVRAIAASQAPVITGIGHETDMILADYVADLRAPTPSAAAEVATPDQEDLALELHDFKVVLGRIFEDLLREERWRLKEEEVALQRISPHARVLNAQQQVDDLLIRAASAMQSRLAITRAAVEGMIQTLRVVGPSAVLARGFALVTHEEQGTLVRSVDQVAPGDMLRLRVSDGEFGARALPEEDEREA
ncbi:MAG: exodeoxyribonuclease VII large subunit [Anaerolineales bacterium]|nr:exodeoxyribonuclease VII large subunit [Anaerolineales bacterium]